MKKLFELVALLVLVALFAAMVVYYNIPVWGFVFMFSMSFIITAFLASKLKRKQPVVSTRSLVMY